MLNMLYCNLQYLSFRLWYFIVFVFCCVCFFVCCFLVCFFVLFFRRGGAGVKCCIAMCGIFLLRYGAMVIGLINTIVVKDLQFFSLLLRC